MAAVLENYRTRIDALPELAQFCKNAEKLVRADNPETLWDAEPLFRELLLSNLVEDFVERELRIVSKNDHHYVLGSSEFHAPLVETDHYSLVLKLIRPEYQDMAPLFSLTEHLLMAVWGEPAEVETFRLEEPYRIEVFDRSKALTPTGSFQLAPGTVARFRAPSQAFRLRLARPALLIQFMSATTEPLRWVFHPESLQAVRAVAASLKSSRLQFTCHTLAALGSPSSVAPMRSLMNHPDHYVRWAAVQSICTLSREDGIECLHQALDDAHPHVRNAARRTLETLQQEAN